MTELEQFLEHFGVPLVTGGKAHVGEPIEYEKAVRFVDDIAHATLYTEAIDDARAKVLSKLVVSPPTMLLDGADIQLLVAIYNILVAQHPLADAWPVGAKHRQRILRHAQKCCRVPGEWTRTRALGRYALFHNLFSMFRTDIKLSWWTGSETFTGETPPGRLYRLKSVRRVKEKISRTRAPDLLFNEEVRGVTHSVLTQVPLLPLLQPGVTVIDWSRCKFALQSPELSRAIVNIVFSSRPWNATALSAYTLGLIQMIETGCSQEDILLVVSFLVYLASAIAVEEARLGYGDAAVTWPQPDPNESFAIDPLAPFFALPNAMRELFPALGVAPGVLAEPAVATRWRLHRDFVAESDPGAIEFWRDLLSPRLAAAV